jgi:hypothetical protein
MLEGFLSCCIKPRLKRPIEDMRKPRIPDESAASSASKINPKKHRREDGDLDAMVSSKKPYIRLYDERPYTAPALPRRRPSGSKKEGVYHSPKSPHLLPKIEDRLLISQDTSYSCGLACIRMFLATLCPNKHRKKTPTEHEIKDWIQEHFGKTQKINFHDGIHADWITAYLREKAFHLTYQEGGSSNAFNTLKRFFNRKQNIIIALINETSPVVHTEEHEAAPQGNHWIIVDDVNKDFVHIRDPEKDEPLRIPASKFRSMYNGHCIALD